MLCDLPFPVFFDDLPDFVHPLDHEHMGIPQIISGAISILMQECIIFCIKGIYRIQQACQMIVERPPPDKRIPVGIRFDLCSINIKLLQGDKAFLFQTAHKLIVQFIQDFPCQLFPFKIVKDIPFWLLAFGQPDKGQVSFTEFNNAVNSPDSPHICIGNNRIQHDRVKTGSSLI